MENDETRLDEFFQRYRAACPDIEPGPNFMPGVWQKIEARHNFWFVFGRLARTTAAASAALCLLLLLLNLVAPPQSRLSAFSYMDALMADHTAESLYYTEAIRNATSEDQGSPALQQ
ncbi:MAG: hypothetical protein JO270_09605 [Acidobacteriaceae bacterium]|nr:hypothetical protein [Acidobacteriaceae bacterium]MBV8572649.1 hypothetical protein [Acidobacteriaceae bacterium]